MNELEQRLRDSLQARADDVEATPQLWDEVQRRVRRRTWQTGFFWAAGAATAAAAAVVAVVVVPGLFETPDQDIAVDPVPSETATDVAPTEDTEEPAVTGGAPTHIVAASDTEISLLTLDGQPVETLLSYPSPEFEGAIQSVAVRPGSTLDDLVVAFTVAVEGTVEVRVVERGSDWQHVDQSHAEWFETVPPQAVWSPDGSQLAWIDTTDGQTELKAAAWNDGQFGDATSMGNVDGLDQFQLQQWVSADRIVAIANGLQARVLLLDDDQLVDVQPLSSQDTTVLDAATTERGVFTLVVPRPDVPEDEGDAEGAVPELLFAPADGSDARELPLPDAMTIGTASPQGMWVDAQHETAVVGWGGLAWLLGSDGDLSQLPDRVNGAELFGNGAVAPPVTDPSPEPGTDPGAAEPGPYVVVTAADLALVTDDGRQVLMQWDEGDGFKPARAEVRPGSTADDLVAVVLSAGEGETELGWIEVRGGEPVEYRRFPDAYQMSPLMADGSASVPVWSPDGDHLAWAEETADGFGLAVIGWDGGPGTGDTATDNTRLGLDAYTEEGVEDLVLDQWLWNDDSEGILTFRYDRGDELGYANSTVQRQPDGAVTLPGDATLVDGSVDEALTDATAFRLIVVEGGLQLAIHPGGDDVVDLPPAFDAELTLRLPPAAGPYLDVAPGGALLFSPDQRVWHVAFDGAATELGTGIRDLDPVD